MKKKELVVKQEASVPTVAGVQASDWGTPEFVGSQDMVIPKILPMQATSQLVGDDKARVGEFRDSVSGELLGSIADPIIIIPFHIQKFWDIMEEDDDGNFKWVRSEPLIENPLDKGYNDNLPWTDKIDGIEIKRIRRMNFFCLLPKQVAAGDSIPYILSFKSTSFREGKKLFTQMYVRNARAKKAPCAYAFVLGGTKQKNDKGTFVVPNVTLAREATAQEINEAFQWFQTIKKGNVKVDESDIQTTHKADDFFSAEESSTGDF